MMFLKGPDRVQYCLSSSMAIQDGIECTLCMSADNSKLSGAVARLEAWDVIQGNLDSLEEWSL